MGTIGEREPRAAEFFEAVFDESDIVEVRRLPAKRSEWCPARDLCAVAATTDENVYFGANPRRSPGGTKAADVLCARCVFVDFDHVSDPAQAEELIRNAELPAPTAVVTSGRGVHAYWRLIEPLLDLGAWSSIQRGLIVALGTDKAIHDPPRIMRVPGSINTKNGAAARVVTIRDAWYAVDEFPRADARQQVLATNNNGQRPAFPPQRDDKAVSRRTLLFIRNGAAIGARNGELFAAACDLAGCGYVLSEVENELVPVAERCGLERREAVAAIRSAMSMTRTPSRPPQVDIEAVWPSREGPNKSTATSADECRRVPTSADEDEQNQGETGEDKPDNAMPPLSNVFASYEEKNVKNRDGSTTAKTERRLVYKSAPLIAAEIKAVTNGWPKLVGDRPFVMVGAGLNQRPTMFRGASDLFGWLHSMAGVFWTDGKCSDRETRDERSALTKQEVYEYLRLAKDIDRYTSVSVYPHHPPIGGLYYPPIDLPEPTGEHLARFIDALNPDTHEDRLLLTALILTPGAGLAPGTRPLFVITSDSGQGCIAAETPIEDPVAGVTKTVAQWCKDGEDFYVWSVSPSGERRVSRAECPYIKGEAELFEVTTDDGRRIVTTAEHRFLTPSGWRTLSSLQPGGLVGCVPSLPGSSWGNGPSTQCAGDLSSSRTVADCLGDCSTGCRRCGGQPLWDQGIDRSLPPSPSDVLGHIQTRLCTDDRSSSEGRIRACQSSGRLSRTHCLPSAPTGCFEESRSVSSPAGFPLRGAQALQPSQRTCGQGSEARGHAEYQSDNAFSCSCHTVWSRLRTVKSLGRGSYYDLGVPGDQNYAACGFWNHNSGKTSTARAISDIWGGSCDLDYTEDWCDLSKRIMSSDDAFARVMLFDNVKGATFGSGTLESAITSKTITGWKSYVGQVSRPNDATFVVTFNDPALTRDLTDRAVVIKIGRQRHAFDFVTWAAEYVAANRAALLSDALAMLRAEPAWSLERDVDRFQAWQAAVLTRIPGAATLGRLIADRRALVDADGDSAADLIEGLRQWCESRDTQEITGIELADMMVEAGLFVIDKGHSESQNKANATKRAKRILSGRSMLSAKMDGNPKSPVYRVVVNDSGKRTRTPIFTIELANTGQQAQEMRDDDLPF